CKVIFNPQSAVTSSGSVAITFHNRHYNNSYTMTVPVSGTGVNSGQLTSTPSSLGFGSVTTGSSASLTETLTNSGGTSVTISAASTTGSGFSLSGLTLPATLTAGQSVSFSTKFSPTAGGAVTGNLAFSSNAANSTLNVPLTGTGVTPGQLTSTPVSLSFSSVTTGSSASLTETLTNSGGTSVTISAASTTGSGFSASGLTLPATLTAGQSVSFSTKFSPTASGSVTGNLAITSNAANSALNVPLTGTGITPGQLTSTPTSLGFGSVATGGSASLTETLTNSGGSALTISQITPSGTGFAFSGITLPVALGAAQSATFTVSFAPQSVGSTTGSLLITSNASDPSLSFALTGSGTGTTAGQLAVTPSSINFGSISIGTTQNQTGALSATSAPVTVSSLGVSGAQFSVSGISFPITIAAGSSVSFQVAFTPQVSGSSSANAMFTSNASNSPAVESLTGSGTAPQHSVSLGWNTSTSSGVAGYNIYRATVSTGPFTRINSALDATPYDTDSTVTAGQTYYYSVTAVSTTGSESGYSNQVQVTIPTP
ncbi:MAG: choice-of-anchor D domain-containing protein, partial [Candidatus Sulfotelmatobacter sp.]